MTSAPGHWGPTPDGAARVAVPDLEDLRRPQWGAMLIGSAETPVATVLRHVVEMIRDIAKKHDLAPFELGYFYSEVPKELLLAKMRSGERVTGLDGRGDLTEAELEATERIVAVAGVHPYLELLQRGAEVIIGGRSSDAVIFAAPAIGAGYPEALSYYLGKVLECASFNAEPYAGKESVIGEISHEDVKVTAMHPGQRCTVASVAGHAMYERSNPYFEYVAGGMLDMTNCVYEQFDERTTRVTGPQFEPAAEFRVKLEGAGQDRRALHGFAGVRDPYTISEDRRVIAWARNAVRERFATRAEAATSSTTRCTDVTASWARTTPCETSPVTSSASWCSAWRRTKRWRRGALTGTRSDVLRRLPQRQGTAGGVAFPLTRWSK